MPASILVPILAPILVPLAARSALTAWAVLSFAAADGPSGAVIFAIAACFYIEELGHRRVERIIASHQEPPAVTPPPANISFVTLLVFAMHAALLAVLAYRAVVPVADTAVVGFIAALFGPPSFKQFGKTLKDQEVRRALAAAADDLAAQRRVANNPCGRP